MEGGSGKVSLMQGPPFCLQVSQRPSQEGGPNTQGCWRRLWKEGGGDRHLLGIDSELNAV